MTLGLHGHRKRSIHNHFVWKNDTLQENDKNMKSLFDYPTIGFPKTWGSSSSLMKLCRTMRGMGEVIVVIPETEGRANP